MIFKDSYFHRCVNAINQQQNPTEIASQKSQVPTGGEEWRIRPRKGSQSSFPVILEGGKTNMPRTQKKGFGDEVPEVAYKLDWMSLIFVAAGVAVLFFSVYFREKITIPSDTLRIIVIASCILFLLGALSWILRFYLRQRTITRVLIATMENAAKTSKTSTEFRDAVKDGSRILIEILFRQGP